MSIKVEISISDILDYVGDRVRPIREGEQVFKAGHIILCGTDGNDEKVIKSLCMKSSSILESPHEITIQLENKWICKCSCKAGLGGYCKHIMATLIYVNRHEILEPVSCTDLAQKWGKEKKEIEGISRPKPFASFCHPEIKKKRNFTTTDELDAENFNLLCHGVSDSALAIFMERGGNKKLRKDQNESQEFERNPAFYVKKVLDNIESSVILQKIREYLSIESFSLLECCEAVLNKLKCSNILEVATQHQQGSAVWKEERKLRITGSTCYSIFTYGEKRAVSDADWERKALKHFFPKGFSNKFTSYGLQMEKEALELFRSSTHNHVINPSLIISKYFPWLGFSPDGIIMDGMMPIKLLEIKCPYIGKDHGPEIFSESCDFLEIRNSELKMKTQHQYYGQVQMGMLLLNLSETVLIVYSSFKKSYLQVDVCFDPEFAEKLITTVSKKYLDKMIHHYCLNK